MQARLRAKFIFRGERWYAYVARWRFLGFTKWDKVRGDYPTIESAIGGLQSHIHYSQEPD